MGKAAKRKLERRQATPPLSAEEQEHLGQAMRAVVGALTDAHGADCLLYASIGAQTLRQLGYPTARMVCGSAAWRVGSGDPDVISHAIEINAPGDTVFAPNIEASKAGMFHAWVELGDTVIDFTTGSLRDKAEQLDAMDGGHTQVDWAPEVLWVDKRAMVPFREVVQSPAAGVFRYQARGDVERVVAREFNATFQPQTYAAAVLTAYRSFKAGNQLRVMGVGSDAGDLQTADMAREASRVRGIRPL